MTLDHLLQWSGRRAHERREKGNPALLFRCGAGDPGARALLAASGANPAELLSRYSSGDWGDVPPEDARENEFSIRHGFRIVSSCPIGSTGRRVWIITEADRDSRV
jgi:hypothetical protein